jgi:hypothetical protein
VVIIVHDHNQLTATQGSGLIEFGAHRFAIRDSVLYIRMRLGELLKEGFCSGLFLWVTVVQDNPLGLFIQLAIIAL